MFKHIHHTYFDFNRSKQRVWRFGEANPSQDAEATHPSPEAKTAAEAETVAEKGDAAAREEVENDNAETKTEGNENADKANQQVDVEEKEGKNTWGILGEVYDSAVEYGQQLTGKSDGQEGESDAPAEPTASDTGQEGEPDNEAPETTAEGESSEDHEGLEGMSGSDRVTLFAETLVKNSMWTKQFTKMLGKNPGSIKDASDFKRALKGNDNLMKAVESYLTTVSADELTYLKEGSLPPRLMNGLIEVIKKEYNLSEKVKADPEEMRLLNKLFEEADIKLRGRGDVEDAFKKLAYILSVEHEIFEKDGVVMIENKTEKEAGNEAEKAVRITSAEGLSPFIPESIRKQFDDLFVEEKIDGNSEDFEAFAKQVGEREGVLKAAAEMANNIDRQDVSKMDDKKKANFLQLLGLAAKYLGQMFDFKNPNPDAYTRLNMAYKDYEQGLKPGTTEKNLKDAYIKELDKKDPDLVTLVMISQDPSKYQDDHPNEFQGELPSLLKEAARERLEGQLGFNVITINQSADGGVTELEISSRIAGMAVIQITPGEKEGDYECTVFKPAVGDKPVKYYLSSALIVGGVNGQNLGKRVRDALSGNVAPSGNQDNQEDLGESPDKIQAKKEVKKAEEALENAEKELKKANDNEKKEKQKAVDKAKEKLKEAQETLAKTI